MAITALSIASAYGVTSLPFGCQIALFLDVTVTGGGPAPDGTTCFIKSTPGSFSPTLSTLNGFVFEAVVSGSLGSSGPNATFSYQGTNGSGVPLGNVLSVTWHTSAAACPVYGPPTSPVLGCEPGDGAVIAHWTAAVPIDPSPLSQNHIYISKYEVHRSTSPGFTPGPTTLRATLSTFPPPTIMQDTGTNGTTYYYKIKAFENIFNLSGDPLAPTTSLSNEVAVTPRPKLEFWGKIVRA